MEVNARIRGSRASETRLSEIRGTIRNCKSRLNPPLFKSFFANPGRLVAVALNGRTLIDTRKFPASPATHWTHMQNCPTGFIREDVKSAT
jgi:hypothetical protein